eukprot:4309216-Pleurochrysis_carterae.AAC.1
MYSDPFRARSRPGHALFALSLAEPPSAATSSISPALGWPNPSPLPVNHPDYPLTLLPTSLAAYPLTDLPINMAAFPPTCLPNFLPSCLHSHFPGFLATFRAT